jgi:hypothetical protein
VNRELEFSEVGADLVSLYEAQLPALRERIRQAMEKYDDLLNRVRGGPGN